MTVKPPADVIGRGRGLVRDLRCYAGSLLVLAWSGHYKGDSCRFTYNRSFT